MNNKLDESIRNLKISSITRALQDAGAFNLKFYVTENYNPKFGNLKHLK
jgi:hypothetical protein